MAFVVGVVLPKCLFAMITLSPRTPSPPRWAGREMGGASPPPPKMLLSRVARRFSGLTAGDIRGAPVGDPAVAAELPLSLKGAAWYYEVITGNPLPRYNFLTGY